MNERYGSPIAKHLSMRSLERLGVSGVNPHSEAVASSMLFDGGRPLSWTCLRKFSGLPDVRAVLHWVSESTGIFSPEGVKPVTKDADQIPGCLHTEC